MNSTFKSKEFNNSHYWLWRGFKVYWSCTGEKNNYSGPLTGDDAWLLGAESEDFVTNPDALPSLSMKQPKIAAIPTSK